MWYDWGFYLTSIKSERLYDYIVSTVRANTFERIQNNQGFLDVIN